MSFFSHIIITSGSGIVLYKRSNGQANIQRSYGLINQLITENYINFLPSNSYSNDEVNIKTYSNREAAVKYVDVAEQGEVLIMVVYTEVGITSGQINKITKSVGHLSELFVSIVLQGKGEANNINKNNWMEVKDLVKEKNFGAYVDQLVEKVEHDDINLHDEDEESEDEEEELEEEKKVSEKKTNKKKQVSSKKNKKSRKWGADGTVIEDNFDTLDFTEETTEGKNNTDVSNLVGENYGHSTNKGFLVNDLSQEIDNILSTTTNSKKSEKPQESSFGFLKKYIGLGSIITEKDFNKSAKLINENLIKKNVNAEVSKKLVESLKPKLIGKKINSFASIDKEVKNALSNMLTNVLSPNTSVNLLEEIIKKKKNKITTNNPYVISIVGVNGVGKSTNLSKLAYWLLNNKFNVLIAACDNFRSGAVEQLQTHERNLNKLISNNPNLTAKLKVFEQGYGDVTKVSTIAKNAIKYAKDNGFDVILMDTAGRNHADQKLMAPLKDFAIAAQPDKIIMVAEALVGSDSVNQVADFNKSFSGANRRIDFFIISKCDTVGELIGTMVNMVYTTQIPILFVGVGQTYTDLRTLSVEWAVNTLVG